MKSQLWNLATPRVRNLKHVSRRVKKIKAPPLDRRRPGRNQSQNVDASLVLGAVSNFHKVEVPFFTIF